MTKPETASFELIGKTEKRIKVNRVMSVATIILHILMFAYLFSVQIKFVFMYHDAPDFAVLNLSLISPLVIFLAAAITFQIFRTVRDWNGKPEHLAILALKRRLESLEGQNQPAQVNPCNPPENPTIT